MSTTLDRPDEHEIGRSPSNDWTATQYTGGPGHLAPSARVQVKLPLGLHTCVAPDVTSRCAGRLREASAPTPFWLWSVVIGGMLGPLGLLFDASREIPQGPRVLGALVWVLAWAPTVVFFATSSTRRPPVPVLAMIGVFFALYFPLQLLMGIANVNDLVSLNPALDYDRPAQLTAIGWTALILGHVAVVLSLPRPKPSMRPRWSPTSLKWYAFGLQLGGLAVDVIRHSVPLPGAILGLFTFAAMLSLLGTAILVVLGRRGHLNTSERTVLWSVILVMAVVQAGTGSVATFARTGVILMLAAWVGGARLRPSIVVGGIILAAVVVTLRGFVIEYRLHAWWSGEDLSQSQRAAVWWSLLSRHVNGHGVIATIGHGTFVVASRIATMDLYADVIHRTPDGVPFWDGRTYHSLVGAFVPRVLWPTKPLKLVGNEFGHRYSYLSPDDRHTSINLPYPVELYVNFGEKGVLFGMFAIGGLLAVLGRWFNRPGQDWVWSLGGIVLLVPVITNLESDFSLVFGGLILNGFALLIVYRFLAVRCVEGLRQQKREMAAGHPISELMYQAFALRVPGGRRAASANLMRDARGVGQLPSDPTAARLAS